MMLGCRMGEAYGEEYSICNRAAEQAAGGRGQFAFGSQPYRVTECQNCIGDEQRGVPWVRARCEMYSKARGLNFFSERVFRVAAKIDALGDDQK